MDNITFITYPVYSISDFLRTRGYELKLEGVRFRLLLWTWIFAVLSIWRSEWIEATPVGNLGGHQRFKMNLYEICVLKPPGDERWVGRSSQGMLFCCKKIIYYETFLTAYDSRFSFLRSLNFFPYFNG